MVGRPRIKEGEKKCAGCGTTKSAFEFYQDRNSLRSQCKACYSTYNKRQREKHHEKRLAADMETFGAHKIECETT